MYSLKGNWNRPVPGYYLGGYYKFIYPGSEWLSNREIFSNQLGLEGFLEFSIPRSPLSVTLGTTLLSWQYSFNNYFDEYQAQLISIASLNSNILWNISIWFKLFTGFDFAFLNFDYASDSPENEFSSFSFYKKQTFLTFRAGVYFCIQSFYIGLNYEDILQNLSASSTAYTGRGFRITGGFHHEK